MWTVNAVTKCHTNHKTGWVKYLVLLLPVDTFNNKMGLVEIY